MATPQSNNITDTDAKASDPQTRIIPPVESLSGNSDHQNDNEPVFLKVVKGIMDIMVDGLSPWVKSKRKFHDLNHAFQGEFVPRIADLTYCDKGKKGRLFGRWIMRGT
ncbi:MAG: hypothetical protein O2913_13490 [Chloroflexi bacterium]|nr:hypothetical protein [Chloroflexota bacterium]